MSTERYAAALEIVWAMWVDLQTREEISFHLHAVLREDDTSGHALVDRAIAEVCAE